MNYATINNTEAPDTGRSRSRLRLCLLSSAFLLGCAGPASNQSAVTPLMERDFGEACARQGQPPGTAAYRACILAYPSTESANDLAKRLREPM